MVEVSHVAALAGNVSKASAENLAEKLEVMLWRREIPVIKEQLGAHCNNTIQGR